MTEMDRRSFLRVGGGAALGLGLGAAGLAACTSDKTSNPAVTGTLPGTVPGSVPGTVPGTTVPASAVADLRKRLKGTVLVPGDPGYDQTGLPANGRYRSIRPAVIAQCADEADVVTCVSWARDTGVPPVGRGGGHSYAGYSTTTGLMIDLSRLTTVALDKGTGVATTGGSAHNRDVYNATNGSPWFLPGGTCLGVGVGGLVLGGGIGYNTHWAGLTADHLTSTRIVTADGQVREVDARSEPDLFWACRGGAGGTFGINTSFTFQLQEVPKGVTYYRFDFRGADAALAVLDTFNHLIATAPAALNAVAMAQATPVGAGGPREAIDVMTRGQYIGPIDELRDLVAPLLAAATPVKQTMEEKAFWDAFTIFATDEAKSHSFGDISRYAKDPVPQSATAKQIDLLVSCPSRSETDNGSIWSLGWVGGDVVNKVGRTETAYVHRGMSTLLRPTTVWSDDAPASVADDLNAWTDDMIAAIAPHTPAESYQNFPNRRLQDWQTQYYAENFDRLVDVKTRYDAGNLFTNAQSIPPRPR